MSQFSLVVMDACLGCGWDLHLTQQHVVINELTPVIGRLGRIIVAWSRDHREFITRVCDHRSHLLIKELDNSLIQSQLHCKAKNFNLPPQHYHKS